MQTFTMKRVLLVCGASAMVCLMSTLSASANLVTDPGFDLGTPASAGGWTAFNGANIASTGHVLSPTKACRLPAGFGIGAFETISNVAFTAGTQFDLTAFGFVTNTMTSGFVGIQATFFNITGTTTQNLGTVESGPGVAIFSNHLDSNSVLNTWIPLDTGVFTAPSTLPITYMQVFPLAVNGGSTGGSVWIDNFDLEIVPEPSTIALGLMGIGLPLLMRRRRKA